VDLLYPLSEFYDESHLPQPESQQLQPEEIPEPYRSLLVHESDMTPTLEAAYGENIHLRVLQYVHHDEVVSRQVLLVTDSAERAVEMGAIKIYLKRFPEEARRLIAARRIPLGTILRQLGIPHESHPSAYFRVAAQGAIAEVMGVNGGETLYGRRNVLSDPDGRPLAEVVEILPPAEPTAIVEERNA
jgi:chorismate-pyruvate lyase